MISAKMKEIGRGSRKVPHGVHRLSPWRRFYYAILEHNKTHKTLETIILALVLVFITYNFVLGPYQIEGFSMEPTLANNDRLIVLKSGRTFAKLLGRDYIPKRGEIVVFTDQTDKKLIKRVVGVPGDTVVIKDNILFIVNDKHPEGFRPDFKIHPESMNVDFIGQQDDQEVRVLDGEIFVIGDNRNQGASQDSRSNNLGKIDSDQIIGNLVLRVFPITKIRPF